MGTGERDDSAFEALLKSQLVSPHAPDLSDRIVAAARSVPQARKRGLLDSLSARMSEFPPLRPVYAFSVLLLLGIFLGVGPVSQKIRPGTEVSAVDDLSIFVDLFSEEENFYDPFF